MKLYFKQKNWIIDRLERFVPNLFCWSDLVLWLLDYEEFSTQGTKSCRQESRETHNRSCYCGKYNNGVLQPIENTKPAATVGNDFEEFHADELPF